jgi:hypothetical protein
MHQGKNFLQLCFQRDPDRRPDVSSLLLHPFVMLSAAAARLAVGGGGAAVRPSTSHGHDADTSRTSRLRLWDDRFPQPLRLEASEGSEEATGGAATKPRRQGSGGTRAASALATRAPHGAPGEAGGGGGGSQLTRAAVAALDLGKGVGGRGPRVDPGAAPAAAAAAAQAQPTVDTPAAVGGDAAAFEAFAVLSARSDLSGGGAGGRGRACPCPWLYP